MPHEIKIQNLSKSFKGIGGGTTKAVDHISLNIEPGELFFLLGPSGCGKTTLLRMIAGFIEPTEGQILFNGRDITPVPANKRNTGMVFQSYALWPHMTVRENVAFGLKVRKIPQDEQNTKIYKALEAVQMEQFVDRKPIQLSGGQQQRIALARALVIEPDVLLLDEPLSNLDAKLRNELRVEIRRICKDAGITSIYVTHDQKEALSMADRIAIMRAGKVEQIGTPDELYHKPCNTFVAGFLGETNVLRGQCRPEDGSRVMIDFGVGSIEARLSDPQSGPVDCVIRPESFSIVEPANTGCLRATLEQTIYLGEVLQHILRVGEAQVKVLQLGSASVNLKRGTEVGLAVRPEDICLFAAEG